MELNKDFELGEWVKTEDGYGQILYIRNFYVEPFVELASYQEKDINGIYKTMYGVKMFCNFEGKIKKKNLLNFYININKLDGAKDNKTYKLAIKNNTEEYRVYKSSDEKDKSESCLEIAYIVESKDRDKIKTLVETICDDLNYSFTFKEFSKEFNKYKTGIKLENFIKYGYGYSIKQENKISFIFFSTNYKTVGKERVFDFVKALCYDLIE